VCRGRKKALWFSISADLVLDAERDLVDVGAGCIPCYNLRDVKPKAILSKVRALTEMPINGFSRHVHVSRMLMLTAVFLLFEYYN
jgi:hypothetical protein